MVIMNFNMWNEYGNFDNKTCVELLYQMYQGELIEKLLGVIIIEFSVL